MQMWRRKKREDLQNKNIIIKIPIEVSDDESIAKSFCNFNDIFSNVFKILNLKVNKNMLNQKKCLLKIS